MTFHSSAYENIRHRALIFFNKDKTKTGLDSPSFIFNSESGNTTTPYFVRKNNRFNYDEFYFNRRFKQIEDISPLVRFGTSKLLLR